ncbi:EF-hand domain-containing protein [Falsirhodobacter sp. alg1]|uniref:EF-hand domain-containing protein n=1 Tax=Falsirhodobacter sp. alg1 TaxID=1472418 RepID=UPI000694E8AF|nr:EF-hand domain-containing protein [Falsirhodobacter sp. alg1]
MTKFLTGLTLAAITAAGLSTAFAQEAPEGQPRPPHAQKEGAGHRPMMMPDFDQLDTNGDGAVTQDELNALRADRAAKLDANNDGKLSVDELANADAERQMERAKHRAERMVEQLDTDGDGLLSVTELATPPEGPDARMMKRLDTDQDGSLSREELSKAHDMMRQHRGPAPEGDN